MKTKQKGFTFLELMSTIAIACIFALWAFPSYTEYLQQQAKYSETVQSDFKEPLLGIETKPDDKNWFITAVNVTDSARYTSNNLAKPELWKKLSTQMEEGSPTLVLVYDRTSHTWNCTSNLTSLPKEFAEK